MLLEGHPEAARHLSSVHRIRWEGKELREVFSRRAAHLDDDLLRNPELREEDPIQAFLGSHFLRNGQLIIENHGAASEVPIPEDLVRYILRHTLGRPRELIDIGNKILEERSQRRPKNNEDEARVIREAVALAAADIASAYFGEVGHRWKWSVNGELGGDALRRFLEHHIHENVIPLSAATIEETNYLKRAKAVVHMGDRPDDAAPLATLASLGLIGFPVKDKDGPGYKQFFERPGRPRRAGIPADVDVLLVHPILCGPHLNIQSAKDVVVGPEYPWSGKYRIPPESGT